MRRPAEVSVVIPTRSRVGLLRGALDSALAQEADVEVLLVDDGSDEASAEALRELAGPRVTVVRHESSRGVAAARNTGIERASAPWIAFLDDDDLWSPHKLRAQLDAVAAEPSAEWSCTGALVFHERLGILSVERAPLERDLTPALLTRNPIPGGGSSVLARTDAVREAGGFDTRFSMIADWDLWLRLSLRSAIVPVDRPLTAYRLHGGNMSQRVARTKPELDLIERKYADVRAESGLGIDWTWWYFWSGRQLALGRHRSAAAVYLRAAWHSRRLPTLGAAVLTAIWPRWREIRMRQQIADGREGHLTPEWRAEADAWLPAAVTSQGR